MLTPIPIAIPNRIAIVTPLLVSSRHAPRARIIEPENNRVREQPSPRIAEPELLGLGACLVNIGSKTSSIGYLYIGHCLGTKADYFYCFQLVFVERLDRETLINTFSHYVFYWKERKILNILSINWIMKLFLQSSVN